VRDHRAVLVVIAAGGGVGALARFGVTELVPGAPARFPWSTLLINVVGCLLMGVLMVLISDVWTAHRLVRPFLGVGVLGGFTTFSTYAVEANALASAPVEAFAYASGTVLGAMLAVITGVWLTRLVTTGRVQ
jgi:CrcB protein